MKTVAGQEVTNLYYYNASFIPTVKIGLVDGTQDSNCS